MRKILAAVIIAVMFCGVSYAERFSKFPAYGICTGDEVYTNPDSEDEEGPFLVSARYIEPEH